jgi:predicted 3-demethylubiquinone-9 3-methyltransferase (glyoxalase superfamily)
MDLFAAEWYKTPMVKIIPSLWYDGNAEDAVNFYLRVFKGSKILRVSHYTEVGPGLEGSVLTISFKLGSQEFLAINGGPEFKFTPAVSFVVNCKTQKEIDYYWDKLTAGGREVQCGWLEDKFGMSWQITPVIMDKIITGKDRKKADRVMRAMMPMKKLDLKSLLDAAKGS